MALYPSNMMPIPDFQCHWGYSVWISLDSAPYMYFIPLHSHILHFKLDHWYRCHYSNKTQYLYMPSGIHFIISGYLCMKILFNDKLLNDNDISFCNLESPSYHQFSSLYSITQWHFAKCASNNVILNYFIFT